jgi:hypothetical protein
LAKKKASANTSSGTPADDGSLTPRRGPGASPGPWKLSPAQLVREAHRNQVRLDLRALKQVASYLAWENFQDIPVNDFLNFRLLAMLDVLTTSSEKEIAETLGAGRFDESKLAEMRENPYYSQLQQATAKAAADLAIERTDEEWVDYAKQPAWKAHVRNLMITSSSRELAADSKDFLDRAMPKPKRTDVAIESGTPPPLLPEQLGQAFMAALHTAQQLREASVEVEVKDVTEKK